MAPPDKSPKLNPLQARTLTILQEMAGDPRTSTRDEATGEVAITQFPHVHGDHFHVGGAVVMSADATGLTNEAVWTALERKGLARASYPYAIVLTPAGLAFDTGLAAKILHRASH